MRRTYLFLVLIASCPLLGGFVWWASPGRAQPSKPAVLESAHHPLPLSRLVLFNTGVAFFQREGTVVDDTRIDLSFPLTDINDLLKSLVVEDGSKLAAVSYDGAEPVENTLRAFALDLASNPTFGQILNQSRGEKVEISQDAAGGQPATTSGVIVGMEANLENGNNLVHHLNLLCTEGMRRVPLNRIQRIRFLNPTMEEEFRRSLSVLSASHNNQRRSLSMHLKGEGKRKVKIGYVVESPIWKASYRLMLGGKNKKPKLQGWAVVENTSDEDWKDIRLVLAAGRPITYQMDLSQPLFMPRPTVEQEVYASLRPPMHAGAVPGSDPFRRGGFQGGGGFGMNGGGFQLGGAQLGALGGPNQEARGGSMIGGAPAFSGFVNPYQINTGAQASSRLTWAELGERRKQLLQERAKAREQARQVGNAAMSDALESLAVDADRIGEGFHYALDQKVTLSRQKSALLPVLNDAVGLARFSIYNKRVHPRFPLHGVKLKNTTGQHLLQGPVAVFDGDVYLGDTRLSDLQPDQERLLSFAMDLGLEVRDVAQPTTEKLVAAWLEKGTLQTTVRQRTGVVYTFRNRPKTDRSLLVEHPITPNWTLTDTDRPMEKGRELYRFAWQIPAGKTLERRVTEENLRTTPYDIDRTNTVYLRWLIAQPEVSKAVKDLLAAFLEKREKLEIAAKEVMRLWSEFNTLAAEQTRIRNNLDKLPRGSAAHKRALDKYDLLETKIEKLSPLQQEKADAEKKLRAALQVFVSGLNAK